MAQRSGRWWIAAPLIIIAVVSIGGLGVLILGGAVATFALRSSPSDADGPPPRVRTIMDTRHAQTAALAREMRPRCATLGEQPLAARRAHLFEPRPALADDPAVANISVECVIAEEPTLDSRLGYRLDPHAAGHDSARVWRVHEDGPRETGLFWCDHAGYPSTMTEDDAVDLCVLVGSYEEVGSVLACVAWRS